MRAHENEESSDKKKKIISMLGIQDDGTNYLQVEQTAFQNSIISKKMNSKAGQALAKLH